MAEKGQNIECLLRQSVIEHTVLQHGTNGAGSSLWSQGKFCFSCDNGVHFFLYHVGCFSNRTLEQSGLFKGRDTDFLIAESFSRFPCNFFHGMPFIDLLWGNIFCSLRACKFICHHNLLQFACKCLSATSCTKRHKVCETDTRSCKKLSLIARDMVWIPHGAHRCAAKRIRISGVVLSADQLFKPLDVQFFSNPDHRVPMP